jgi:uncharacterized protein involved in exopolysaccharide biosynthesis
VDETPDESALVSSFIGRVNVEPVRGSRLVDVSFDSEDPAFAAQGANALMEENRPEPRVETRGDGKHAPVARQRLSNQQAKVEQSRRALSEYRDKQNAMSLDDKQNIVGSRLNQLNDAYTKAKLERVQKETQYNQIKPLLVPGAIVSPDSLPITIQNAPIQQLKTKFAELQQTKAQASQKYGDKHPTMITLNAQITETQSQLSVETQKALQTVKNEYDSALLAERTYANNLEAAKADAQDLSRKSVGYNVMERESKSNRTIYESLLQREKELRVSSNSRSNNVKVVDRAEIPKSPLAPTGRRTWIASLAVGFGLAVAVAFGLDYMNDTIKTPEDITRRLKLPFLGLVPSVRDDKHPVLASSHVPHDFGEAFRSLRTSIMSRFPAEGTKILVVTSAQPLEGKTTTACNIAMALAYGGARVLVVDADMRRPGMHRPLRLTNERGLSQVLIGQARVRDVIQRTVDPNLLAITAGRHATQSVRAAGVGTHEDAAQQPLARAVRLDRARYAAGARRDRRRHSGAARQRRDLRHRRRDDAPPARPARARNDHVRVAALRGRGAQPGRLRAKQVLLFALLRPSVQELLRRSLGLIRRASSPCWPFSVSHFSVSRAKSKDSSCRSPPSWRVRRSCWSSWCVHRCCAAISDGLTLRSSSTWR